jgi:magnesium-transporting ATPase (P-type)
MRSTCVVEVPGQPRLLVLIKGSPERVHDLVAPASLPSNFESKLQAFTDQGLRVLAMAFRLLPAEATQPVAAEEGKAGTPLQLWQTLSQDELEAGASFLGLVLMVNR